MMHRAWSSIVEVPYCFSRSCVKFQGHMALKIVDFDPNWAFPDCISSLESPMARKWCTKLEVALKRCPIVFQGHPSNFKVTRLYKSLNLTQIGRFQTVTPVWIHRWLWNVAQSLKQQRRDAKLFSKVIHQISRSHGTLRSVGVAASSGWFRLVFWTPNLRDVPSWRLVSSDSYGKQEVLNCFTVYPGLGGSAK